MGKGEDGRSRREGLRGKGRGMGRERDGRGGREGWRRREG
jgi:hypothetical protein